MKPAALAGLALAVTLAGPPSFVGPSPHLGPSPLSGQAAGEAGPRRAEVNSLRFRGNETLSDGELRAVIVTRSTECTSLLLSPFCLLTNWGFAHRRAYLDTLDVRIDADRLRLYYNFRGHFEADVRHVVRTNGVDASVSFIIEEGPATLIDEFSIEGLPEALGAEEAAGLVDIGVGDPFDRGRLQAGVDSLIGSLRRQGYVNAMALEDFARGLDGTAQVALDVRPGARYRLREVRIEGGETIGEDVIRDLFTLRAGDYYNQEAEQEGQRNLFGLEAIRFASIRRESPPPEAATADSALDLVVQVTPAPPLATRVGFGWSTDQCLRTETRLTHRNLFGGGRRLEFTGQLGNIFADQFDGSFPCSQVGADRDFRTLNYLLQAELLIPVALSAENSFSARVFVERETIPDVFIQEGFGAEIGLTRRLGPRMSATLSYSPGYTGFGEQSADIFFCINFGFCEPEDIVTVSRSRWLAPLTLSGLYNETDDALRPTRGYYLTAEGEVAHEMTGSQYRYARIVAQAALFRELEPGLVIAARARTGIVRFPGTRIFTPGAPRTDRLIHPSRRFFVGGSQSVRGVGPNLLGPRVLVADEAEDCPAGDFEACVERLATQDPGAFDPRPRGGDAHLELSIELRRYLSDRWSLVFFGDAGSVSQRLTELRKLQWTPGMGLRYASPIGSIRLDIGYNTTFATELPAIVSTEDGTLVQMPQPVLFDPFRFDDPHPLLELWRRVQIHVSIGEAF
ncbi:BamA/TamA family outer membrane protein [Candidatus Palauibacter irciniicola]|uniref:BamA/TamA family outer membrane protein n=1 Tax=Candidatus Palauibacter irciniicola TaxID=3056733 RepID=UPI003B01B46E